MELKVIKTQDDYNQALIEINELMDLNPQISTPEANRLELLSVLVEVYENEQLSDCMPDPIEAIKFRMEQQGLKQSDLTVFIGNRSKVSEVLSSKRPLSLSMIRALNSGLGIPLKVLMQEYDPLKNESDIEWEKFPLKEMVSRGWVNGSLDEVKENASKYLSEFFKPVGGIQEVIALYKKTENVRSVRAVNKYALAAWTGRVMSLAATEPIRFKYQPGTVTLDFMRDVARLSWSEKGPLLAKEFLRNHGIHLIIQSALPNTYLDGAAIMVMEEKPIIGLSLRYDRIDNFWFCLMHELAHIALHNGQGIKFYDDLELKQTNDPREREADALAGNALIPDIEWEISPAKLVPMKSAIKHLAEKLRIHPAIVAGRMRREHNSYHLFTDLVGQGQVKKLFDKDM